MSINMGIAHNMPVINVNTQIVTLPANAVGGTAEELLAAVRDQVLTGAAVNLTEAQLHKIWPPYAVSISNPNASTVYIRDAVIGDAAAGEGLPVVQNDRVLIAFQQDTLGGLLYESASAVCVVAFFASARVA